MKKLNELQIDHVCACMMVLMNAVQRCNEVIMGQYEKTVQDTKEYKLFVKKVGKAKADAWVKEKVKEVLRYERKSVIFDWMDAAQKLCEKSERLLDLSIRCNDEATPMDMFDALSEDSQLMIRLFFRISEIPQEDYIKIETMLQRMANRHVIDYDAVDYFFRPNISGALTYR